MSARVAVVTGGNKGIGFAIVKQLAQHKDVLVYLTARNEQLGKEACAALSNSHNLNNVRFHQLDITDDSSIAKIAEFLKREHNGLDILVNNAGMAFKGNAWGEDVARTTIRTNYSGTLAVCEKLLPLIKPNGRVVNVTSRAGSLSKYSNEIKARFLDPNLTVPQLNGLVNEFIEAVKNDTWKQNGWPGTTYGVSKAAENALTRILAREEHGRGVLINSCCPGWVKTDMAGPNAPLTPDQGAETPVWLALLPPNSDLHGKFCAEKNVIDW